MIQTGLHKLEHAVRTKPAIQEMLKTAYREVLILGLIAFVVFLFEISGSEAFAAEGSGAFIAVKTVHRRIRAQASILDLTERPLPSQPPWSSSTSTSSLSL